MKLTIDCFGYRKLLSALPVADSVPLKAQLQSPSVSTTKSDIRTPLYTSGVVYALALATADVVPYVSVYGARYRPMRWTARLVHRDNSVRELIVGQLLGLAARFGLVLPSLGILVRAQSRWMPPQVPSLVHFRRHTASSPPPPWISFGLPWVRFVRLVLHMLLATIVVFTTLGGLAFLRFRHWNCADRLFEWMLHSYLDPIYTILPLRSMLWFWYVNGIYAIDIWRLFLPKSRTYENWLRGAKG